MADDSLRCPTRACQGWICLVDEETDHPFWGCGECGAVWADRSDLDDAISGAVECYPHRLRVYRKSGGGWSPVPPASEPADYAERVEAEWNE